MWIRVFLVDEHEVVRRGVAGMLAGEEAIQVVGEAGSVGEALARAPRLDPDVIVGGMWFRDGSGAELYARLRALLPGLRCLILSRFRDPGTVAAAVAAGASGYLVKHARTPAVVSAVRAVAAGQAVFDGDAQAALRRHRSGERDDALGLLTPRERAVLQLIGQGLTNRQIGMRLGLAEKTVKNYTSNLLGKLGLERRTQAAIVATELRHRSTRRTDHRRGPSTAEGDARPADTDPGDLRRGRPGGAAD